MKQRRRIWLAWWIAALFAACGGSGGGSGATASQYSLVVNTIGSGAGLVSSSPPGIDCGSDCAEVYAPNTSVTLTAAPVSGSQFSGWSGAGCSGTNSCVVAVSSATEVTAVFSVSGGGDGSSSPGLAVTITGVGTVTSAPSGVNCGPLSATCDVALPVSSTVALTAAAGSGYRFAGWAGPDCSGTGACNITIGQRHGVDAVFVPTSQFAARPFLFKGDEIRLRASISAGDAEAIGSSSNSGAVPLGFLTLAQQTHLDRAAYSDISTWHLAFAGWLLNSPSMQQRAHDEVMAIVGTSTGDTGTGDNFQHVEERLLEVAATVDLAFAKFSASDLTKVATWVNGTLNNWDTQNAGFWPNDEPRNNYWQNGFLAFVVGGIATEGFNPQASTWRAQAATMATKFKTATTAPRSTGPVQTEGHYYSGYVSHALWAMELYDAAMGTTLVADSAFSFAGQLDLAMFQTRPHLIKFFSVGSEANNSLATHTGVSLSHWYHLAHSGRYTAQAQHAKSVLATAEADTDNFWRRADKGFTNFYWNLRRVNAQAAATKAERFLVTPSPGAGLIGIRSSAGFQTNARAALVFANQFNFDPAYSHSNPDAPGFQWASGSDWLVTDPDYFSNSGILAEAGSNWLSDISNIVTLNGQQYSATGGQPLIKFARDNSAQAIPHYYIQIDAANYWTGASTYRREYVWLDDLQAVVIFDRIVGTPAKKWRLHVPAAPTINLGAKTATYTVGGKTIVVRDLLATGNGAWVAQNLNGTVTDSNVWRLSQDDSSADYRSLKVLDVGGRVTSATLNQVAGTSYEAVLTLNGVTRRVKFFENADPATVQ